MDERGNADFGVWGMCAVFYLLRRRFPGLYQGDTGKIWGQLWLITLLLGCIQLLATGFVDEGSTNFPVVAFGRLSLLLAMVVVFYLAGITQERAAIAAKTEMRAKEAAEEVARKDVLYVQLASSVQNATRLRHDIRQAYSVLLGLNKPGKEAEFSAYCASVLAELEAARQMGPAYDDR